VGWSDIKLKSLMHAVAGRHWRRATGARCFYSARLTRQRLKRGDERIEINWLRQYADASYLARAAHNGVSVDT